MAHADAIGLAAAKGVPDSAIPPALSDRAADNWRPLLAVAALAGGTWPARAYQAAVVLSEDSAAGDRGAEWSLRQVVEAIEEKRREVVTEYLAWRRAGRPKPARAPALGPKGVQRPPYFRFLESDALAGWLMNKDDSGFGALRDLGAVKLRVARMLRPFKIVPTQRKISGQPVRGYDVLAIRAVWRRYQP